MFVKGVIRSWDLKHEILSDIVRQFKSIAFFSIFADAYIYVSYV